MQALVRIVKEGWTSTQAEVPPALRVYHPFRDKLTVHNRAILKGERLIVPAGMKAEMKEKLHHNHAQWHISDTQKSEGNLLLARYEQGH